MSTLERGFQILAFTQYENLKLPISFGVLLVYLLSVLGNLTLIALVFLEAHLHTPMCFFLCNLSVLYITYVCSILPKLMMIILMDNTEISFPGCFIQMSVFALCVDTYFLLLTTMAYDRYVAVCKALHYLLIMKKKTCAILAVVCWLMGALNSLMCTLLVYKLSFCKSHDINHFFCDLKTILKLSCSDTTNLETIISSERVLWGMLPFALILTSYGYIISTILKICSSSGRLKSFSSCSTHITMVIIYCVTVLYMKPEWSAASQVTPERGLPLLYGSLHFRIKVLHNPNTALDLQGTFISTNAHRHLLGKWRIKDFKEDRRSVKGYYQAGWMGPQAIKRPPARVVTMQTQRSG